ncbi:hypothetical protein DASC09_036820 [Saccharomycopsis crataegensis]|uniref:Centromere protein H C-terminal domain-containing protein n=1 Tax=Saccharomycopsis crataegensis TaxID=43959 RepID=A0AAV5QNH3_9ASCO|nr:hypothetical protein DASC09_036820 [Saccharomycopsis crataegensis]
MEADEDFIKIIEEEISSMNKLIKIADENIKNLKTETNRLNQTRSEAEKSMLKAIALQKMISSIPYTPKNRDLLGKSLSINETSNQVEGLTKTIRQVSKQDSNLDQQTHFQKMLRSQLLLLINLFDEKLEKKCQETRRSNVKSQSDVLSSTLDALQERTLKEQEREKILMAGLKKFLIIISKKNLDLEIAEDDTEKFERTEQLLQENHKDSLKIIQTLLNGMMTNENGGFVKTSTLNNVNNDSSQSSMSIHPLIRQLLKSDLLIKSDDLEYVKLRSFGMDFDK